MNSLNFIHILYIFVIPIFWRKFPPIRNSILRELSIATFKFLNRQRIILPMVTFGQMFHRTSCIIHHNSKHFRMPNSTIYSEWCTSKSHNILYKVFVTYQNFQLCTLLTRSITSLPEESSLIFNCITKYMFCLYQSLVVVGKIWPLELTILEKSI